MTTLIGIDIHITLLGYFGLLVDGRPQGPVPARVPELIAYLILHPQKHHTRRDLAFLLWPDTNETQAQTNLRKLIHQLRSTLPEVATLLQIESRHISWGVDAAFTSDVSMFEVAIARAKQARAAGDTPGQQIALQQAVAVYGGDLLQNYDAEWLLPIREQLRREFFSGLERLILLLESERQYRAAIEAAHRLVEADPLHEASYRYLMRLYKAIGDRARALHAYHSCATALQRELNVAPSPTTQAAHEELLTDATLAPGEPPPTPTSMPMSMVAEPELVGRRREWAQLQEAWRAAAAGKPGLVLLVGEGGVGKTRLAEEFLDWAANQGISIVKAHCYATEQSLAYGPVIAWLRARPLPQLPGPWQHELGRLLPELGAATPSASEAATGAGGQQRFFEALALATLAIQPRICFVDDLQWCDPETLDWLHFLLRYDQQAQLLIVGTVRPEEVGEDHRVQPLRTSLQRADRLREITLGPLGVDETRLLAAETAGREVGSAEAAHIYEQTEGNPLLIVEMVRTGLEPADAAPPAGLAWNLAGVTKPLPPRVQSLLIARLAVLSPGSREVANLAATIGREFTFSVLFRASQLDEESLVRALDELWQRRIIREQSGEAYDFCHDKLREVTYGSMGIARRRMLHRRVAQALIDVHGGDKAKVSGEVAAHFEQAGNPADAVRYYQQAAEGALRVFASATAITNFENAIRLLPTAIERAPDENWEEVRARLGAGLREAHSQAERMAEGADRADQVG